MESKIKYIVVIAGITLCSISVLKCQVIALSSGTILVPKSGEVFQTIGIENIIPTASLSLHIGLNDRAPSICKLDITPTGFHHAYLAHQVVPMIGIDFIRQPASGDIPVNTYLMIKGGMKFSTNRLLGGFEYGIQPIRNGQQFATISLGYVIGLTHDCLRKRIHQQAMRRYILF